MRSLRLAVSTTVLAVLALWSGGCIDFEEQSLTYEHHQAEDR